MGAEPHGSAPLDRTHCPHRVELGHMPRPLPPPRRVELAALDATFMYQYPDLPEPYHQSTVGIPHQPKKLSTAVVPGLVRISNRAF